MQYRRELFVLSCLGLMEALSGFALLLGIGIVSADPLHGGLFWLLLLATWLGTLLAIVLGGTDELTTRSRLGIGILIALLCVLPPATVLGTDLGAIALTALLLGLFIWRGTLITGRESDHFEVQRRFSLRLAMILLAIVVLVARGETENEGIWLMLSLVGISYVCAGLAALGVSRLNEAGSEATEGTGIAIGGPVAGLLLLSLGGLALVSVNVAAWIAGLLSPIWDMVVSIVALALTALVYPLFLLAAHFHLGGQGLRLRTPLANRPVRPPNGHPAGHAVTLWSVLGTAVVVLCVILVAVLLTVLILRVARARPRKRPAPRAGEERRTLVSPREAIRLFLAWLRGLFGRGAAEAVRAVEVTRRRVLGPSYPTDPIRRVYAQVLHRAARNGLTRPQSTTPWEFELHLQRRWPEGGQAFSAITQAYVRRRYAEESLTEDDIRRLREHWQQLRRVMRAPS